MKTLRSTYERSRKIQVFRFSGAKKRVKGVINRIRRGQMRWRGAATEMSCDKTKSTVKGEGELLQECREAVNGVHGSESRALNKKEEIQTEVTETRMLRRI